MSSAYGKTIDVPHSIYSIGRSLAAPVSFRGGGWGLSTSDIQGVNLLLVADPGVGRTGLVPLPHLLPTGSEEREVFGVGSIPAVVRPSYQDMKTIAS